MTHFNNTVILKITQYGTSWLYDENLCWNYSCRRELVINYSKLHVPLILRFSPKLLLIFFAKKRIASLSKTAYKPTHFCTVRPTASYWKMDQVTRAAKHQHTELHIFQAGQVISCQTGWSGHWDWLNESSWFGSPSSAMLFATTVPLIVFGIRCLNLRRA